MLCSLSQPCALEMLLLKKKKKIKIDRIYSTKCVGDSQPEVKRKVLSYLPIARGNQQSARGNGFQEHGLPETESQRRRQREKGRESGMRWLDMEQPAPLTHHTKPPRQYLAKCGLIIHSGSTVSFPAGEEQRNYSGP